MEIFVFLLGANCLASLWASDWAVGLVSGLLCALWYYIMQDTDARLFKRWLHGRDH